jgi:hypothetical protein
MSDLIGLAFILLIVVGGLYLLTRPVKPLTVDEFEKRANENRGLMGAGMLGLQKVLDPGAEKAIQAQEDFRQGYLDGEQESGDGDDKNEKLKMQNANEHEQI